MRLALAALFVAFLVAPAVQAAADPSIVGRWYEEANYGGSHIISINDIRADGTFTSIFRRCLPTGEVDTIDTGTWTYVNGVYRTVRTTGTFDEYQTESNDGRVWVYRGIRGQGFQKYGAVRFRDIKVSPDSKVPQCDLTS